MSVEFLRKLQSSVYLYVDGDSSLNNSGAELLRFKKIH